MKLKQDFITNSSSTSFIISILDDWNEANFLKAIGIEGDMPINEIFSQLFDAIERNKQEISAAMNESRAEYHSVNEFLEEKGFGKDTIHLVEKLLSEGRTVYYGRLRSDGNSASEVYFCMESFVVCEDDIYFNGRIGGW